MMATELDQFQHSLCDWLARNQLDHDLDIYAIEEWKARGEFLLDGASFVVTSEGGLCFLLNYSDDTRKLMELEDLCASFGYWFELGHTWSVGFYHDKEAPSLQSVSSRILYREKLQTPRWKHKAALVRKMAKNRCQDCGTAKRPLHAHHCWYRKELEPWQYPLDAFRCLCETCHNARDEAEHRFKAIVAAFTSSELTRTRKAIERLFYWYDRKAALEFLDAIGPNTQMVESAATNLANCKTEPGATNG